SIYRIVGGYIGRPFSFLLLLPLLYVTVGFSVDGQRRKRKKSFLSSQLQAFFFFLFFLFLLLFKMSHLL
ncbi:hypothetical protein CSUI_006876, partial [Cystoisospora suis]